MFVDVTRASAFALRALSALSTGAMAGVVGVASSVVVVGVVVAVVGDAVVDAIRGVLTAAALADRLVGISG